MTFSAETESRFPVGSSVAMMGGSFASARAMAAACEIRQTSSALSVGVLVDLAAWNPLLDHVV